MSLVTVSHAADDSTTDLRAALETARQEFGQVAAENERLRELVQKAQATSVSLLVQVDELQRELDKARAETVSYKSTLVEIQNNLLGDIDPHEAPWYLQHVIAAVNATLETTTQVGDND